MNKTKQDNEPLPVRHICSICRGAYYGYGNNAWPITQGRCCDFCNNIVITARIHELQRGKEEGK